MIPAQIAWEPSWPAYDLPPDLLQVWRVHLDRVPASLGRLAELLSRDERDRAVRFHFERDRRHFTLTRGALRLILGGYLTVDPKLVVFGYEPLGKPFLAARTPGIRFNVAHSGELALVAVSLERELGVDVEFVRPLTGSAQLGENYFSRGEVEALRSLPGHLQPQAFFACWTRKEAYVKARGGGLSIPLDSFEVSCAPGQPAALLGVCGAPGEGARWGMEELQPAEGYIGALVAERKGWRYCYRDWPGR